MIIAVLCMALVAFLAAGLYNKLETTEYTVESSRLPQAFDGFVIVQLSDLHLHQFGDQQQTLILEVDRQAPDIIVLTGDMIDDDHGDLEPVRQLLLGLVEIAPVYAVDGNHEFDDMALRAQLHQMYRDYGVVFLDGEGIVLERDGETIGLCGARIKDWGSGRIGPENSLAPDGSCTYNILLHHYANHFDQVKDKGFDLVLAGHSHGGIVRLPLFGGVFGNNGGIIGNNGGFFPEYDSGRFDAEDTVMIVSRGLGDAEVPRFFNRRQLVRVVLRTA